MITVYNLICNNRADQVAIARNIAEQLTGAYNGTDLNAAAEAYKAIREAEMKVFEMRGEAEDKVKLLFSVCDDEDKSVNIRAIFKAKRLLEQMSGAWRVISSLSPIVERLRFDGEADQFEVLLEMVEGVTCDANADAYEINRIYYRVFDK